MASPALKSSRHSAGQAVASGAAGFLVVALDVFGQIVMDDEADIGFVDAHAEGDGGADDADFVAQEKFLVLGALAAGQSGVVRAGGNAVFVELVGQGLGAFAALAINNPAVARAGAEELQHLRERASALATTR